MYVAMSNVSLLRSIILKKMKRKTRVGIDKEKKRTRAIRSNLLDDVRASDDRFSTNLETKATRDVSFIPPLDGIAIT